jgi:hypothetical protein
LASAGGGATAAMLRSTDMTASIAGRWHAHGPGRQ